MRNLVLARIHVQLIFAFAFRDSAKYELKSYFVRRRRSYFVELSELRVSGLCNLMIKIYRLFELSIVNPSVKSTAIQSTLVHVTPSCARGVSQATDSSQSLRIELEPKPNTDDQESPFNKRVSLSRALVARTCASRFSFYTARSFTKRWCLFAFFLHKPNGASPSLRLHDGVPEPTEAQMACFALAASRNVHEKRWWPVGQSLGHIR